MSEHRQQCCNPFRIFSDPAVSHKLERLTGCYAIRYAARWSRLESKHLRKPERESWTLGIGNVYEIIIKFAPLVVSRSLLRILCWSVSDYGTRGVRSTSIATGIVEVTQGEKCEKWQIWEIGHAKCCKRESMPFDSKVALVVESGHDI